jgi:hypothetical protein
MANLNLSQFTEKTLVADADWVFVWDTAGSISKKVSRNSLLNSGTLATSAPVTISQTWNGTGSTVFNAFVVNATTPGTTSSSSSLLLDLQVGGVSQFKVDKTGNLTTTGASITTAPNGTWGTPSAIEVVSGGHIRWASRGRLYSQTADSISILDSSATLAATLAVEATNTLALRNGAAAQTFNVYGTYTSGSVYERMFARYDGTALAFQVGTQHVGASARPLQLLTDNTARMTIGTTGNVGIGTTAPSSKLHVAETWNASGTTFAAAKIVVTDTASMAASTLLELWSDAVTPTLKYSFGKSGNFQVLGGNSAVINCAQLVTNTGVAGNTDWGVYLTNSSGIILKNTLSLGWSSGVATLGADTVLRRDDEADHLAMRRTTNGQKFSVYGTYPGAAWERFTITAPTSGNVLLGTYKGTGGIARGLELQTDGVTKLSISGSAPFLGTFGSASNAQWLELSANAGTTLQYNSTHKIYFSSTACEITASNTTITTGLVRFSGNTASFPALKRSTTSLQAVLANDSGFTNIQGKLTTDTAFTSGAITDTGYIVLYDSTGTAYKVACTPV